MALISPRAPRAIYFNDDVYVGFVQDGPVLELASIDPKAGPVFYVLEQQTDAPPRLERRTDECKSCHVSFERKDPIARLFVLSSLTNPEGVAINAAALSTTDQSPLQERWGGWYVTGTHGGQRHLGNIIVRTPVPKIDMREYVAKMDLSAGANVTDLSSRFDTKPYLSPHSDIAALMVLTHQSHIHNLMTLVNSKVKDDPSETAVSQAAEPLVKAMLFAWTPELSEPISGTSNFAAEFARQGPHDSQGRSLRDLDLHRRLLRYPLSYLIYSKPFDELPGGVRQYVYRRIRAILTNQDKTIDFAHLSAEDRAAILEILRETKPEVLAGFEAR